MDQRRHLAEVPGAAAAPAPWRGALVEIDRCEWRPGDAAAAPDQLAEFLTEHGLAGEPAQQTGGTAVVLLAGAASCAALAGLPAGRPSPSHAVPELVAVACRPAPPGSPAATATREPPPAPGARTGSWTTSWTDAEHAVAIEVVREAIGRGEVYQANVVGHRSAPHSADPRALVEPVARLPGATYAGVLSGAGWAVGSASPERLVRLTGDRLSTVPIKGTLPVTPGSASVLRSSAKDRAEHVMIVDLERNDLARVAVTGSVEVAQLYALRDWAGLWQASSTVTARLAPGAGTLDVLRALLPGGSVTGAPKRAACALLAGLEPVGRGPAMGAFGLLWPGGMDLGLTIRTVAADDERVHLWAGGGITWSSDAAAEVAEAHAKAGPVVRALAAARA